MNVDEEVGAQAPRTRPADNGAVPPPKARDTIARDRDLLSTGEDHRSALSVETAPTIARQNRGDILDASTEREALPDFGMLDNDSLPPVESLISHDDSLPDFQPPQIPAWASTDRYCKLCCHPLRDKIDIALAQPKIKPSAVAREFDVSQYQVKRHHAHMLLYIGHAAFARQEVSAARMLEKYLETEQCAIQLYNERGSVTEGVAAARLRLGVLDSLSKATGLIREQSRAPTTVNVNVSHADVVQLARDFVATEDAPTGLQDAREASGLFIDGECEDVAEPKEGVDAGRQAVAGAIAGTENGRHGTDDDDPDGYDPPQKPGEAENGTRDETENPPAPFEEPR